VIAQRLVRVLCVHCKEPYVPTQEERKILGAAGETIDHIYRPVGCAKCANKGYKGRSSVMELLVMDVDLDELVARGATAKELRTTAIAHGFRPLAEEGLARVADGTTSIAEVSRAVDLTGRLA